MRMMFIVGRSNRNIKVGASLLLMKAVILSMVVLELLASSMRMLLPELVDKLSYYLQSFFTSFSSFCISIISVMSSIWLSAPMK